MLSIKQLTLAMASAAALCSVTVQAASSVPIEDQYIVVLDAPAPLSLDAGLSLADRANRLLSVAGGGLLERQYQHALLGFTAQMPASVAKRLSGLKGVRLVEQDQVMTANDSESNATWGLDRIDQHNLPLNGVYNYPASAGQGVNVYVIDTGLNATHTEFTGRVGNGQNFAPNNDGLLGGLLGVGGLLPINLGALDLGTGLFSGNTDPEDTTDCAGHGTHVSGTVLGTTYGVAKLAVVHPVRVLGCSGSGSTSGVIAGVDWVTANAVHPAVANMSLGGGDSAALDTAVENAIASGVTFAVAAGNDSADACSGSPNKVPEAITVGATDSSDAEASYSNYGTCVDIYAPGTSITSAWYDSDTATNTISGTSMATPHVTGAAALVLGEHPSWSPQQVTDAIVGSATLGVLTGLGSGSPNALLYTGN